MYEQPINTAICSFGVSGRLFHAPFIVVHPGFNLYCVWERTKALAAARYPGTRIYKELDEMLEDPAVELVIVNTPNNTHYEYAKKSLLAGKHVIVEKPFTVEVDEAAELIALAVRMNKKLSVYQNRRYDSDFKTVRKIVHQGLLGDLVEVEIHFDRFRKGLSPKLHKETAGPGTGVLLDLGSHLIDQAIQLFGLPTEVFADIRILRPVSQVSDYFELLLYYPSLRVRLKSSYLVREALPGYILHGTQGSFIKAKTDNQEEQLELGISPDTPGWGTEPDSEKGLLHTEKDGILIREHVVSERGNYSDYFEGIYQAIRHDQPLPVTAIQGMDVILIIEAAIKSATEKRLVKVNS